MKNGGGAVFTKPFAMEAIAQLNGKSFKVKQGKEQKWLRSMTGRFVAMGSHLQHSYKRNLDWAVNICIGKFDNDEAEGKECKEGGNNQKAQGKRARPQIESQQGPKAKRSKAQGKTSQKKNSC